MSIDINANPGDGWATAAQKAWDEARSSHGLAMDRANDAEMTQYQQMLRALQLFAAVKSPLDASDRTAIGLKVGTKAAEQWTANVPYTAAILTGLADSMGTDLATLCTQLQAATLPAEFQAARVAIASA